jgi:hypothetical protein
MEDAVVNNVVDSSVMQYAVIAGLRTETGPERLVIAYPNEESLRDLIAAPSIIAMGFSSAAEAIAGSTASVPTAATHQQISEAAPCGDMERDQQELNCPDWGKETGSTLQRRVGLFARSYNDAAKKVTAFFFSRNAVSVAIRMVLGSSV